jgi:hypothetical protein
MSKLLKGAGAVIGVFVAAIAVSQVLRPDSTVRATDSRRSIQAAPTTSSALAAVLGRSCGDCHSNTMASRWYTRVPPFSALMARAATEGRKAINFSEWTGYSPEQQQAVLLASCTDATRGTMPMKAYTKFRRDAELSSQDVATICSAARQVQTTAITNVARQSRNAR